MTQRLPGTVWKCEHCGSLRENDEKCGFCGALEQPLVEIPYPRISAGPDSLPRGRGYGFVCLGGNVSAGATCVFSITMMKTMCFQTLHIIPTKCGYIIDSFIVANRPVIFNEKLHSRYIEQLGYWEIEDEPCVTCGTMVSITCTSLDPCMSNDINIYLRGPVIHNLDDMQKDVRKVYNKYLNSLKRR